MHSFWRTSHTLGAVGKALVGGGGRGEKGGSGGWWLGLLFSGILAFLCRFLLWYRASCYLHSSVSAPTGQKFAVRVVVD